MRYDVLLRWQREHNNDNNLTIHLLKLWLKRGNESLFVVYHLHVCIFIMQSIIHDKSLLCPVVHAIQLIVHDFLRSGLMFLSKITWRYEYTCGNNTIFYSCTVNIYKCITWNTSWIIHTKFVTVIRVIFTSTEKKIVYFD